MEGATAPNSTCDTACVASPHSCGSAQPVSTVDHVVDIREPRHVGGAPQQASSAEPQDPSSLTTAEVSAEAVVYREPTGDTAAGSQHGEFVELGTLRCCSSSNSMGGVDKPSLSSSSSCTNGPPGKGACCNVSSGKLAEEAECR